MVARERGDDVLHHSDSLVAERNVGLVESEQSSRVRRTVSAAFAGCMVLNETAI